MPPRKATKAAPKNDLRAFFGASQPKGSSQATTSATSSQTSKKASQPLGKSGTERSLAIEISDEENGVNAKSKPTPTKSERTPAKPLSTNVEPSTRSSPVKRKKPSTLLSSDDEDQPAPPKKRVVSTRRSVGATPNGKNGTKAKVPLPSSDDEEEPPRPVTKTPVKKANGRGKVTASSDSEEDIKPAVKRKAAPKKIIVDDSDASDADSPPKSSPPPMKKPPAKRKPASDDDFESLSEDEAPKAKKPPPAKKAPTAAKSTPAKSTAAKSTPAKASTSTPKAASSSKTTDVKPGDKPKVNWAAARAAKSAGPAAPGSKAVPTPLSDDCLEGLAFVFTGELSAFSREEATELAKRYGGRVTGQPSSKTSFVVLGDNAGPSKIAAIKKNNLTTLDEDGFLNLIATRRGPSLSGGGDETMKKKREKEEREIKEAAREMEKRERAEAKGKGKAGMEEVGGGRLWTQRYAPANLKEVCGNKGQVEKLLEWLQNWDTNRINGFKKPGKSGAGVFRAVMISGPPGIGKTTSAHLCAKLAGYTPIELNASDARSKKLVEASTNIQNTSLDGWMGGGDATNAAGIKITDKSCLIMDEVDGMSGGDRGGIGAINALIKKSRIPVICIANDRSAQKMKPLVATTFNMPFRRPEVNTVRSRILSIIYKEGMKIPANVIDQLIQGSQSDIRQVLNMLSTWKLSNTTMDFDEGTALAKVNEKYTLMTPFNVISKMFGPYTFSATSRETLGDKMEYYFHDHQFMGLFVQENYLKGQPAKLRNLSGPEKELEQLRLMDRAATSISEGDLVDSLIHGPEQHWGLMPLHSVVSFVRPASFLYGGMQAYGPGGNSISFPQWLGQNSKQNKLQRQLGDMQTRMRLKVSGDKAEIRQSYIPALFPHVVQPLLDSGSNVVDDVIDFMDDYFLSRHDWDTLVELGVDDRRDELVLKKVSTATKTAFTKKYNAREHPIPFHKASDLGKAPKKLASSGPAPDIEDAFDLDEEAPPSDEEREEEDEDVGKDKLLKAKKANVASGSGSSKPPAKSGAKKVKKEK